jgi:hypothetical protein
MVLIARKIRFQNAASIRFYKEKCNVSVWSDAVAGRGGNIAQPHSRLALAETVQAPRRRLGYVGNHKLFFGSN